MEIVGDVRLTPRGWLQTLRRCSGQEAGPTTEVGNECGRRLEASATKRRVLAGFAAAWGKGGVRRVRDFELGDGAPEAFEIVETAGLFGKDVDDEAAEIEQSPIGGALTFAMFGLAL